MKLLLFDIDGTLVLTGGAGVRAMDRAFETVFGVARAFEGVKMPGRTDPSLLAEAIGNTGVVPRDGDLTRFERIYVEMLAEEILKPAPAGRGGASPWRFKGALPGVVRLIDRLHRDSEVFLALVTGNYSGGAEIKLAHFDLWRHFRCGAFGEDAAERHELVPVAVERARRLGCPDLDASATVVIGDTPHDVACARDAGVGCVAVATGGYSAEALKAAGASTVFETLEDTDQVLRVLR